MAVRNVHWAAVRRKEGKVYRERKREKEKTSKRLAVSVASLMRPS